MTPTVTVAVGVAARKSLARNAFDSLNMNRASSSNCAPASVSSVPRESRANSRTPSSSSNERICLDNTGCAMCKRCAARPKFNSSATATKYLSLRMSRSGPFILRVIPSGYRDATKRVLAKSVRRADRGGMSLKNSRVLVIGGTSGIGLGVATAVAERGAVPPSISPTRHRSINWCAPSATSNTWCSPRGSHSNWPACPS